MKPLTDALLLLKEKLQIHATSCFFSAECHHQHGAHFLILVIMVHLVGDAEWVRGHYMVERDQVWQGPMKL
jgi:hypothetical protein